MENVTIRYRFTMPGGGDEVFDLELDERNLMLKGSTPEFLPPWTDLEFYQCPNCRLTAETRPHCPVAVNLVSIVAPFSHVLSYNEIHLEVTTKERVVSKDTTAQEAVSSLIGIVMATSDCPNTTFFRSMARFHLPLASEEETVCRATSMYLLAQYFLKRDGRQADLELAGLTRIYGNMHIMNTAIAARLQGASEQDSTINAIVMLDMFALTVQHLIEGSLEEVRYMFEPFLAGNRGTGGD